METNNGADGAKETQTEDGIDGDFFSERARYGKYELIRKEQNPYIHENVETRRDLRLLALQISDVPQ